MFVKSEKTKVVIIARKQIVPGVNFIPDAIADKIVGHPMFVALKTKGEFKVVDQAPKPSTTEPAKTFVEEIAGMTAKDAVAIVKQNYNRSELEALIASDDRKSVLNAAERQLDELEIVKDEEDDDEAEIE